MTLIVDIQRRVNSCDSHCEAQCEEQKQMNTLNKAMQLLSSTTADAIERLFPQDQKMLRFAKFIRSVDSWVDVHNSNTRDHSHKPLKAGYGGYIFSH